MPNKLLLATIFALPLTFIACSSPDTSVDTSSILGQEYEVDNESLKALRDVGCDIEKDTKSKLVCEPIVESEPDPTSGSREKALADRKVALEKRQKVLKEFQAKVKKIEKEGEGTWGVIGRLGLSILKTNLGLKISSTGLSISGADNSSLIERNFHTILGMQCSVTQGEGEEAKQAQGDILDPNKENEELAQQYLKDNDIFKEVGENVVSYRKNVDDKIIISSILTEEGQRGIRFTSGDPVGLAKPANRIPTLDIKSKAEFSFQVSSSKLGEMNGHCLKKRVLGSEKNEITDRIVTRGARLRCKPMSFQMKKNDEFFGQEYGFLDGQYNADEEEENLFQALQDNLKGVEDKSWFEKIQKKGLRYVSDLSNNKGMLSVNIIDVSSGEVVAQAQTVNQNQAFRVGYFDGEQGAVMICDKPKNFKK